MVVNAVSEESVIVKLELNFILYPIRSTAEHWNAILFPTSLCFLGVESYLNVNNSSRIWNIKKKVFYHLTKNEMQNKKRVYSQLKTKRKINSSVLLQK